MGPMSEASRHSPVLTYGLPCSVPCVRPPRSQVYQHARSRHPLIVVLKALIATFNDEY